jgi:predicted Zn-dependent protease
MLSPHFNEAPLHGTLGQALLELGDPREALPHLREAQHARPQDPRWEKLIARAREEAP